MKIVSEEDENIELDQGVRGQIMIKPTPLPVGYLNDRENTNRMFTKDGWVRTGDRGWMDDRNHLFVIGKITHTQSNP